MKFHRDNKFLAKTFQTLIVLSLTIGLWLYPPGSATADDIQVYIDQTKITYDVPPQVKDSRTLVPIRKTFENLDANVKWNSKDNSITIVKEHTTLKLTLNKKTVWKNGKSTTIDVPVIAKDNRTFVPIRFIADSLGYKVKWNNSTRSVLISSTDSTDLPQEQIPVTVLMYHHFQEGLSTNATVEPHLFKEQLLALKEQGYTTINDHDLLAFMEGKKELPQNPLLITMDDGYVSNYEIAYPILKELDMKATVYIIGSRIEDGQEYEFPRMTWAQAKEMYESGVFEIQSHTYDMHHKGKTATYDRGAITTPIKIDGKLETQQAYEKRVLADLLLNEKTIEEKVGNNVISFAYPFGDHSDSAEKLLKQAGIKMTFTIKPGMNYKQKGPFKLNRINVPGGMTGKTLIKELEKYQK